MFQVGRLQKEKVRILSETPPYIDDTWAIHSGISYEKSQEIINAFLALDINQPDHQGVLEKLKANKFIRAYPYHFYELIQISGRLGYFEYE